MTIKTNRIFDILLKELNLDFDISDTVLNDELENIVSGVIIESNDCVTLTTLSDQTFFSESIVDKIGVQDFTNHFHIESYLSSAERDDLRIIVSYSLKTLKRLIKKFGDLEKDKIFYSLGVETIELGKILDKDLGWEDDNTHINGCRISFYKNPTGETVTVKDLESYKYNAMMTIQT